MGREIRRVPANWEHPMQDCPHSPFNGGCGFSKWHNGQCYHPMRDIDFDTALKEWLDGYEQWKQKTHPDYDPDQEYWDFTGAPPDPHYYHPKWESAEWYQVYETVSEGTPVTPPFATKAELVDYLVEHGDYWDQQRVRDGREKQAGWDRANAESFVEREFAMSAMIYIKADGTGEFKTPRTGS